MDFGNLMSTLNINKLLLALCDYNWSYYIICDDYNKSNKCGKCNG